MLLMLPLQVLQPKMRRPVRLLKPLRDPACRSGASQTLPETDGHHHPRQLQQCARTARCLQYVLKVIFHWQAIAYRKSRTFLPEHIHHSHTRQF